MENEDNQDAQQARGHDQESNNWLKSERKPTRRRVGSTGQQRDMICEQRVVRAAEGYVAKAHVEQACVVLRSGCCESAEYARPVQAGWAVFEGGGGSGEQ